MAIGLFYGKDRINSSGINFNEWKANTNYKINQYVTHNYCLFKSLAEHTSSNDFENDLSNWELIVGGSCITDLATQTTDGLMSKEDKEKLDLIDLDELDNILTLDSIVAGDNIEITKDTDTNTITIKATGGDGSSIDDENISETTTYSSEKIEDTFATKTDLIKLNIQQEIISLPSFEDTTI